MAAQACSVNCSAVGCISDAFQLSSPYGACSVFSGGKPKPLDRSPHQGAANRGVFLEFAEPLDVNA